VSVSLADSESLFAAHQQGVFRYLCRIVGQTETARDLTQEVFLRVSRAPAPDADSAGRRAWVFKIARNLALNYLRDTRHEAGTAELVESAEPAVQELGTAIRQALAALAELDRDVFLLRETAGLSYDEIAGACELSVEAVRARLKRARQQLREALAGPIDVHRNRPVRCGHARFED
jgi:RNA polymerase sigma-70 factor (ECF subfamily)